MQLSESSENTPAQSIAPNRTFGDLLTYYYRTEKGWGRGVNNGQVRKMKPFTDFKILSELGATQSVGLFQHTGRDSIPIKKAQFIELFLQLVVPDLCVFVREESFFRQ